MFPRHYVKPAIVPPATQTFAHHAVADIVQRHDPDRFLTALFAPAARRPALFTLYAFNHELARAHEAAREPGLALIRLQWWREVVEGERRPHDVATPLAEALASGTLPRAELLAMIEAREAEVEPAATLSDLLERLRQGPGSLAAAAGIALGAAPRELERLRSLGTGIGLSGLLRNVPAHARLGRCHIPAELLARHGLSADAVIADPATAEPARRELAAEAGKILGPARRVRGSAVAAALPAVLARRDLRRPPRDGRGIGDKLAVLLAAALGVA